MQFRKKPVVIEAMQWDGTYNSFVEITEKLGVTNYQGIFEGSVFEFRILTLEGDHRVNVGDWVIRGVAGEFYPCKPGIFAQTYEAVESPKPAIWEDPNYVPCPACNITGVFKFSPAKDCTCGGDGYIPKI